jgi:hypothetical protein
VKAKTNIIHANRFIRDSSHAHDRLGSDGPTLLVQLSIELRLPFLKRTLPVCGYFGM